MKLIRPCRYVVLFFYPKDFTFVCPTEIIAFSDRSEEFKDLNCEVIAASTDTPEVSIPEQPLKLHGLTVGTSLDLH